MSTRKHSYDAWAVVDECGWFKGFFTTKVEAVENCFNEQRESVRRMVPFDPDAAMVVRAAVAANADMYNPELLSRLRAAVDAYLSKRKGRDFLDEVVASRGSGFSKLVLSKRKGRKP